MQQGGGGTGGPDAGKVFPGDGLLGENAGVDILLEGSGVDPAGGQRATGIVVPMTENAEHDVVRTDAVGAGAHRFIPGVTEDGEHFL